MDAANLTTIAEAAKVLAAGGPTVGLLALLYAIHTGRLVTAREHKAVCDERDRLQARFDAITAATERALDRIASDVHDIAGKA